MIMRNIRKGIIRTLRIAMHEANLSDVGEGELVNDMPTGAGAQDSVYGNIQAALREMHDDKWLDHYIATGDALDYADPTNDELIEAEERTGMMTGDLGSEPKLEETRVCKKCGSENVWVDAMAHWAGDKGYVLRDFDPSNAWCDDCDGECTIVEGEPRDWN